MDDLKPCPFCGGSARTKHHLLEETWSVYCGICPAKVEYVGLTEREAISVWNTRPTPNDGEN
jgi:Lar family restriction alleviation protein